MSNFFFFNDVKCRWYRLIRNRTLVSSAPVFVVSYAVFNHFITAWSGFGTSSNGLYKANMY